MQQLSIICPYDTSIDNSNKIRCRSIGSADKSMTKLISTQVRKYNYCKSSHRVLFNPTHALFMVMLPYGYIFFAEWIDGDRSIRSKFYKVEDPILCPVVGVLHWKCAFIANRSKFDGIGLKMKGFGIKDVKDYLEVEICCKMLRRFCVGLWQISL